MKLIIKKFRFEATLFDNHVVLRTLSTNLFSNFKPKKTKMHSFFPLFNSAFWGNSFQEKGLVINMEVLHTNKSLVIMHLAEKLL